MRWTRILGAFGLVGQAAVVVRIAGLDPAAMWPLGASAAAVATLLMRTAPATASMIGWGGLGMTLGWWADLGFQSAADVARLHGIDAIWCRAPALGALGHEVPGFGHFVSWMNAGMIAFGMPVAAFGLPPASLLRCTIGMILGMSGGSLLASRVASGLAPAAAVLVDYTLMSAGMYLGMIAVERLPWRGDQMPRKAAIATRPQPAIVTRKPRAPA